MRRIYQSRGADTESALKIQNGGTNATTLDQAADNLELVTRRMIGVPGGVILLNAQGTLDKNALPDQISDPSVPVLYGNGSVLIGGTLTFKITNYDSSQTYTATAVGGTVSVVGEDVIFVAGATPGAGSVTVNGRTYSFTVADQPVAVVTTPTITSPVNGATGLTGSEVTVTASTFAISNSSDTHLNSDWEVSTTSSFTTLVASSYLDTTHLTSWTIMALQNLTKYYVRTRQRSSGGKVSDWSAVSNFTTKDTLPTVEQAKLLAGDPNTNDVFGSKVAVSDNGNTAVIGAYNKTGPAGATQGAAYIFTRSGSTWTQQAKLLASDGASNDAFGSTVALSADGNTAIIGARDKAATYAYQGAVYVFTRSGSTWTQQAKLLAGDPAASDAFGFDVDLSADGNTAAIGANYKTGPAGATQGAAYIFTRSGSTWTQQAKLLAGDPAASDWFGWSVALSSDGNNVIVGASQKAVSYLNQGAAYVFTRSGSTWTQQAKLIDTNGANSDLFGIDVALSSDGNIAVVGAYRKTYFYTNQGAVFIFTRSGSTWTQQAMLLAGDPAASDHFGYAVDLSADGSIAIIGAYNKSATYSNQGVVYIFTRSGSTWTQQAKLTASDKASSDSFGASVALSANGATISIGATGKVGTYTNQGAAYVFA